MSSHLKTLVAQYKEKILRPTPTTARDEHAANYRASAMEKVSYTSDFPECLLVLPELFDGAIGQGAAKKITALVHYHGDGIASLRVIDNGVGIKNLTRLKQWAATKSITNLHRNGHGTKKFLTKLAPDINKAVWSIRFRNKGRNVVVVSYPFDGDKTPTDDDENDETSLLPSGTEICILFDVKVLGDYAAPDKLSMALKEIIQTRYNEKTIQAVEFEIDIKWDKVHIVQNSKKDAWHSFRYYVEKMVEDRTATAKTVNSTSKGAPWSLYFAKITVPGTSSFALKEMFPHYGHKNQQCSRVHIYLGNRMIEAAPFYQFIGRASPHNDYNGFIAFVEFTSDKLELLPEPSTTKVTMHEQDPIYVQFKMDVKGYLDGSVDPPAPEVPAPSILSRIINSVAPPPEESVFELLPPPRTNVTKKLLCEILGIETIMEDVGLCIIHNGIKYPLSEFVPEMKFRRHTASSTA